MRDILDTLLRQITTGSPFVLATVIRTWGSAPRKTGAHMLITPEGKIEGSVSGGCVEGDVVRQSAEIFSSRESRMIHYGVSDDTAWQAGLSCGGEIDIFLEVFHPDVPRDNAFWKDIDTAIRTDRGAVITRALIDGPPQRNVLAPDDTTDALAQHAAAAFARRAHAQATVDDIPYFLEVVAPRHKMLIIGAAHIAVELISLAQRFGFEVTVIDPRAFFTDSHDLPIPKDKIINAWPAEALNEIAPDAFTYAVTLSHDPKIDDQALHILLRSPAAYIGALGSRKTHAARTSRLREAGFSDEEIARIHAPAGIDIRAQSAAEIALSILAEAVKERNKFT